MMSRLRNTAPIALLGIVCVAASYLPVAPIALLAALVAVLLLPAWAAARYAAANGAAGDALERSAYAYGGLALSCWSLWVIGSSIGLSRPLIVAAPVIGAVALTMVGGLQPSPAGPESDSADAGSDSGSSRQRHGARPERFAVILTAVTLAVLVIIPFLPYRVGGLGRRSPYGDDGLVQAFDGDHRPRHGRPAASRQPFFNL